MPDKRAILAAARQDPAFREIEARYAQGPAVPLNINGPNNLHKALLIAALTADDPRKPCLVVPDELRARAAHAELTELLGETVLVFRARQLNLTEALAASRDEEMKHLAILERLLAQDFSALIVVAGSMLQKLMPVREFQRLSLPLQLGGILEPDDLCEKLQDAGYERVRQVDYAGQFARRGDIIDIGLAAADEQAAQAGLRVSFFDNEIDQLKVLDLENQRSREALTRAAVPPVREVMISHLDRQGLAGQIEAAGAAAARMVLSQGGAPAQATRLRELAQRDAERVQTLSGFPGLERWLSLIYPQAVSVLDYAAAAGCAFFVDEPLQMRNRLDAAQADFLQQLELLLERGQVTSLSEAAAFRAQDPSLWLDEHRQVVALCQIAASGNGLPGGETCAVLARAGERYRGRETQLFGDLRRWQKEAFTIRLYTGSANRAARIRQLLVDEGLSVPVSEGALQQGLFWPDARLALIGVEDLFGTERRVRRRKYSGQRINLFSDLVPGELVVHEEHGIGRYDGLVNLDSGGFRRDYLQITYANSDTLYIPMEKLDQIQKFIHVNEGRPRLSKLGGQDWNRLKSKARDSIRKLATDLVALYAKRSRLQGHAFAPDTTWQQEFEEAFPYEETPDQRQAIREIKADMESERVMDRLLCGDVGFGKTEVCFRALFKCVVDGKQAAMMAPTTVLTQQHYEQFCSRVADFPIRVRQLSRFVSPRARRKIAEELKRGDVDVVIGTHRLLSKDVVFKDLGLLVIDEEHRFGVDHKEQLKDQHPTVDVLTLTATPIPRTLHLSVSGIRDISLLEEGPEDRRPVQTYVMEYDPAIVTEAILREVTRNGQVFYLFNNTRQIAEKAATLSELLPGVRIGYAHGQMGERQLEDTINQFIQRAYDVLVCTTIIESGIDMPNVNTIIVEQADRLGLAQLYQIRGRVGRSERQAFAYITFQRDRVLSETSEKRLAAIRDYTELGSGFKIALRDLEVRGAGSLLGAEQHGHLEAIGYDLYCKILDEAIHEARGEAIPAPRTSALIELETDAFLSPHYIRDDGQRMDIYRRLADIRSWDDHQDVLDELTDRFGDPPAQAVSLADIAYLRSWAERSGISRIQQQGADLFFRFDDQATPDMDLISRLMAAPSAKGMLLFNAGHKPYIVYRRAGRDPRQVTGRLVELFRAADNTQA